MKEQEEKNWYVYMLRCEDNSLYTGITLDLKRREKEHITKNENCAKYTRTHQALRIESAWKTKSRVNASRLEFYIKKLNKKQKEEIVNGEDLRRFLEDKIEINEYERCL